MITIKGLLRFYVLSYIYVICHDYMTMPGTVGVPPADITAETAMLPKKIPFPLYGGKGYL